MSISKLDLLNQADEVGVKVNADWTKEKIVQTIADFVSGVVLTPVQSLADWVVDNSPRFEAIASGIETAITGVKTRIEGIKSIVYQIEKMLDYSIIYDYVMRRDSKAMAYWLVKEELPNQQLKAVWDFLKNDALSNLTGVAKHDKQKMVSSIKSDVIKILSDKAFVWHQNAVNLVPLQEEFESDNALYLKLIGDETASTEDKQEAASAVLATQNRINAVTANTELDTPVVTVEDREKEADAKFFNQLQWFRSLEESSDRLTEQREYVEAGCDLFGISTKEVTS